MQKNQCRSSGFTLLELIMAIMILSVMMLLSFFCFDAVVQSWRAGMEMSESLGQADHVIEQLASGLRSAYYPDTGAQLEEYGFQLSDGGEGPEARDSISWVKIGRALVGEDCGFSDSPHRIGVSVADGGQDEAAGLMVKAWRVDLQLDEFDPEEDVTPVSISPRVIGLNCRVLDKDQPEKDDEPNWQDTWDFSNSIPKAVEITLYMEPPKAKDEPMEVKRVIEIPMFDLSQNPRKKSQTGGGIRTGGGTRPGGGIGGGGARPPGGGRGGGGARPGGGRGGGSTWPGGGTGGGVPWQPITPGSR
ncbi:MAG: prepilin-type N-terminal cleavage/methylation domain-containing protein [bacterium]